MKIDPPAQGSWPNSGMNPASTMSRNCRSRSAAFTRQCRTDIIKGEKRFAVYDASVSISNMAGNDDLSKKYYKIAHNTGEARAGRFRTWRRGQHQHHEFDCHPEGASGARGPGQWGAIVIEIWP